MLTHYLTSLKIKFIEVLYNQTIGKRTVKKLEYTFGVFLQYVDNCKQYPNSSKFKIKKALSQFHHVKSNSLITKKCGSDEYITYPQYGSNKNMYRTSEFYLGKLLDEQITIRRLTDIIYLPLVISSFLIRRAEKLMIKLVLSLTQEQFDNLYQSKVKEKLSWCDPTIFKIDIEVMDNWFNKELSYLGASDDCFTKKEREKYLKGN
jgi:hypothetical protein